LGGKKSWGEVREDVFVDEKSEQSESGTVGKEKRAGALVRERRGIERERREVFVTLLKDSNN